MNSLSWFSVNMCYVSDAVNETKLFCFMFGCSHIHPDCRCVKDQRHVFRNIRIYKYYLMIQACLVAQW